MTNEPANKVYAPKATISETKAESVNKAVRDIQKEETDARNAKTARLRKMRLAMAEIDNHT